MASDAAQGARIAPAPLDPGVLSVVRASAGRLFQVEEAFVQQLQYHLVSLTPDVPVLRTSGWAFCERMVRALLWAAITDQPPVVVADGLRQLGIRNRLDGFPESQYVALAHALVRATRELDEDDWSTSTASAWIGYFTWVRPHLLAGAQIAASEQAARQQRAAREQAALGQAVANGHPPNGEVDLERVGNLINNEEDEEEEDGAGGYGQIMLSMTRANRRDRPHDEE